MSRRSFGDSVLVGVVAFLVVVILIVAISAVMAFPVMLLWNYLFTYQDSILGAQLPRLDFWHAWMLLLLTGILVRSNSSSASNK